VTSPPAEGGPRFRPLLIALGVLVVAVAYAVPLTTTADPLWFLPTQTRAERIEVDWQGTRVSVLPADPRYQPLLDALNDAFTSPTGIELNYGLRAADVDDLRAGGRAVEALYAGETRAHGRYALGAFTRVLVSCEGVEYERRLVFVGDARGYRAGPLRAPAPVERLCGLARATVAR
jgi:hypothetical protein